MNIFAKPFIKKGENPTSQKVREKCGNRAGILCIILNTILAGAKIALGALSGAVSVMADGFNNLTDCGGNVVSIIGFKVSGKPADKEHPFGHQRAESITSLLIAVIIMVVAVELAITSVNKIITPEKAEFSFWLLIILGASIIIKLYMFAVNRALGKLTNSENLNATAADSLSDSVATAAVFIATVVSPYVNVPLDGIAGVGVALFIAFTGFKLLKETVSKLIGAAPEVSVIKDIEKRVFTFDGVKGIHDLAVHSYGQNNLYATVHVEIDAQMPIMEAHELADAIEKDFAVNTGIFLTVHIDPLVLNDPRINKLKDGVECIVKGLDESLKIHDFRVVGGSTRSNVVFDVVVPFEYEKTNREIEDILTARITEWDNSLGVVVTVERQ